MSPEALATLHAAAFPEGGAWSTADFAALLAAPGAILLTAPGGFLLGRSVAGEAELLMLAVAPDRRRRGIATALLERFAATCMVAGAERAFLEVAEDNAAARALYAAVGFRPVGRRAGYYLRADGTRADAVILARAFARRGVAPAQSRSRDRLRPRRQVRQILQRGRLSGARTLKPRKPAAAIARSRCSPTPSASRRCAALPRMATTRSSWPASPSGCRLEKVAAEYPDTDFAIIDMVVDLPNVRSVLFKEHEGSYLVGMMAAMASETGTIGFIGGMDIPLIRKFACGYVQGGARR
jgi:ribosomal-protein-alanine N-acetyltransferase